MQYLDNDIDDLFRKAAEDYPLSTSGANWEVVQAMLAKEEITEHASKVHFRWMVLIFTFLLADLTLDKAKFSKQQKITAASHVAEKNAISRTATTVNNTAALSKKRVETDPGKTGKRTALQQPVFIQPIELRHYQFKTSQLKEQPAIIQEKIGKLSWQLLHPSVFHPGTEEKSKKESITIQQTMPAPEEGALMENILPDTSSQYRAEANQTKKTTANRYQKGFYASIIAAPEISTVKYRKFSKAGFNAGLLVGYAFTNRIALEGSVFASQKHYYSDGKHYKSMSYLPSYSKILSIDGYCRMIEIPVALRYSFAQQKKHGWFATAGVSSYLMQQENYNMDYLYLSSGMVATHYYTYTNKQKYWIAALQFSVGHTITIGTLSQLRIEPYLSLPLRGIGHGQLPISSIGLRVGVAAPQF